MKKFLMPLLVLVLAAVISATLYFVRIEIHKDWQTTIGTVTKVEITRKSIHGIGGGGKTLSIVISLVLILSFSGCTSKDNIVKSDSKDISIEELKNDYPEFFNLSTDGGLTVYIWQMSENNYRCYLTNTHIDATSDESFACGIVFPKGGCAYGTEKTVDQRQCI